ncbi:putative holin-like toxin [Paenibacillus polymyxa]|uniref:putative holin-like toxin n=1 Tax=Paenibacillus polymyxa TaxID=1406 RepID=UPI003F8324A5
MKRATDRAGKGGRLTLPRRGVKPVTVFEALSLMLTFGALIVTLLEFNKRK